MVSNFVNLKIGYCLIIDYFPGWSGHPKLFRVSNVLENESDPACFQLDIWDFPLFRDHNDPSKSV